MRHRPRRTLPRWASDLVLAAAVIGAVTVLFALLVAALVVAGG